MSRKAVFALLTGFALGALGSETVISEDKTASGDWEVTVGADDVTRVTAVQSGAGRIVKKGAGALILEGDNTFSGGVTVDEGSVEPHHSNAFGTGRITLNADGVKVCHVAFTKGQLTFTNDLELVGTSSIGRHAFYFHSGTNAWNGRISAPTGDFYMCDNGDWCYIATGGTYANGKFSGSKWSTNVSGILFMTFNGEVSVPHGTIYLVPDGQIYFNGKVTCDTFDSCYREGLYTLHDKSDNSFYANIIFGGVNDIRQFNAAYAQRQFGAGSLDGSIVHWPNQLNLSEGPGKVRFSNGTLNRIVGFSSVFPSKYATTTYGTIVGASSTTPPPKVIATGEGVDNADNTLATHSALGYGSNRYFDFAVDGTGVNPGFTQIFSNRVHVIQGALAATNGTLRFVGKSVCSNATALAVGPNGVIDNQSTEKGGFYNVQKVCIAATGRLKLATSLSETFGSENLALELETGAVIDAPAVQGGEELRVKAITVGGVPVQQGVHASSEFAGVTLPAGVTFTVIDPAPALYTAMWTGADEGDNLMTTMANWQGTPASLDLASGLTKVTFGADGTEMIPGEGRTFLHSIENQREYADGDVPFTLGAAGKTIEVAGSVTALQKGQLIVRGTIAPPAGIGDQGAPAANGGLTFHYHGLSRRDKTWPTAYLKGQDPYGVPLVLDGATIAKPYYSTSSGGTGACHLRTMADTENRFTGQAYFQLNAWSEFLLASGSTLEFAGGVGSAARIAVYGAGTMKISGRPWTTGNGLTMEGGAGKIVLDVESNFFGNCSVGYGLDLKSGGGTIEFRRSNCFVDGHQMAVRNNSKCVVEFNCTTQRIARLGVASTHSQSVLHGEYGAVAEITGGCRTPSMTEGFAGMSCSVQVTGGLGFHMTGTGKGNTRGDVPDGKDDRYVLTGKDFQSCGDLEVSGGQLSLTTDATWKNGTNFTVRGTGQLRFGGIDQINRDFARLHIADEGTVYLGGSQQHIKSAEVKVGDVWVEVPAGKYNAYSTGLMAGRIVSPCGGKLIVGAKGTTLLLR